ncbi:MAG: hypothetical protein V3V99_14450 [candidate division Zixibacteria bacterium]
MRVSRKELAMSGFPTRFAPNGTPLSGMTGIFCKSTHPGKEDEFGKNIKAIE